MVIIWYFEYTDIFTLSNFPSNENLLQYFPQQILLGQAIFENISYPIYFLILQTSFIYFKSFLFTIFIK